MSARLLLRSRILGFVALVACLAGCGNDAATPGATVHQLELVEFVPGACLGAKTLDEGYPATITDLEWVDGRLQLGIDYTANCCAELTADADLSDGRLRIDLVDAGEPCHCLCPYHGDFVFDGVASGELRIELRLSQPPGSGWIVELDTVITLPQ